MLSSSSRFCHSLLPWWQLAKQLMSGMLLSSRTSHVWHLSFTWSSCCMHANVMTVVFQGREVRFVNTIHMLCWLVTLIVCCCGSVRPHKVPFPFFEGTGEHSKVRGSCAQRICRCLYHFCDVGLLLCCSDAGQRAHSTPLVVQAM